MSLIQDRNPIAVVYGYVGQKCAVFPLQLHGFNVCPVNSVQLSTHTGYQAIKGQRLSGEDLQMLADGLEANGVLSFATHVLTGYIANESFLRTVAQLVQRVRSNNPFAVYVCDPVLGDDGKLYVPAELIPVYRSVAVPLATLLTPNQTEAEALTGMKISDLASAVAAMNALHALGSRTVVLTSTDLSQADLEQHTAATTHTTTPSQQLPLDLSHAHREHNGKDHGGSGASALPAAAATMLLLASCPWEDVQEEVSSPHGIYSHQQHQQQHGRTGGAGGSGHAVFAVVIRKLPASFTGTGDLTAALLLANYTRYVQEAAPVPALPAGLPTAAAAAGESASAQAAPGGGRATNFVRAVESTLASLRQVCVATMERAERLCAESERAQALLAAAAAAQAGEGGGVESSTPELIRARCLVTAAERGLPRGYHQPEQAHGSDRPAGRLPPIQSFHELHLIGAQAALVDPCIPADGRAVPVFLF